MKIIFENELGRVELSGGGDSDIRITDIKGHGIPCYDRRAITSFDFDGAVETGRRIPQRSIVVGGDAKGNSAKACRLFKILSEPCRMEIITADFAREIEVNSCEAEFNPQNGIYTRFALALSCDDPYFYDAEAIRVGLYAKENLITDETVLPAMFSSRTAGATITPTGDCDIEAEFVILGQRIEGEEDGEIVIENLTTGKVFRLLYVPEDGELITIDMTKRTITSDINGSLIEYISDDSFLSDLVIDKSGAELSVIGFGATGQMQARLVYKNKYIEAMV